MTTTRTAVPTFDKLLNPTLAALHKLGGSASIQELVDEIISELRMPSDVSELPHGRGSQTELEYRSAWARNYLKNYGLIENSDRGIWALTAKGTSVKTVDGREVVKAVQRTQREQRQRRHPAEIRGAAIDRRGAPLGR